MASPALKILVSAALTIAMPFIILWSSLVVLIREILQAFYYAWLEARIEFNSYLEIMKRIRNDGIQKR